MRELNEQDKTVLDADASIYAKRDERSGKEKMKDLKGKEKRQFFKDYYLKRILAVTAGAVIVIMILVTVLGPKDENLCNVAVFDNPFAEYASDAVSARLSEELITNPKHQVITFDTAYYMTSMDNYSYRTKFMTYTAAGEIDLLILPEEEMWNYLQGGIFTDLYTLLPADYLSSHADDLLWLPTELDDDGQPVDDTTSCYAINVTEQIERLNGFELKNDFYAACMVNAKNPDTLQLLLDILNDASVGQTG